MLKLISLFTMLVFVTPLWQHTQKHRTQPVSRALSCIFADTLFFSTSSVYVFASSTNDTFFVLSDKYHRGQKKPPFADYEVIRLGKSYSIRLELLPSPQLLEMRGSRIPPAYLIADKLFWSSDTIRVPIYSSPDISTKYIRLDGR